MLKFAQFKLCDTRSLWYVENKAFFLEKLHFNTAFSCLFMCNMRRKYITFYRWNIKAFFVMDLYFMPCTIKRRIADSLIIFTIISFGLFSAVRIVFSADCKVISYELFNLGPIDRKSDNRNVWPTNPRKILFWFAYDSTHMRQDRINGMIWVSPKRLPV